MRGAVFGAMLGAAVLTSVPAMARTEDLVANRPAAQLSVQKFDAKGELARHGVKPVVVDDLGRPLRTLVDVDHRLQRATFEYPSVDAKTSTSVTFVPFSRYAPELSTEKLTVKDPRIQKWLDTRESGETLNFENTDKKKLADCIGGYLGDRGLLKDLGITDLARLTPKQAAALAGFITVREMIYNYSALGYDAVHFPGMATALDRIEKTDSAAAQRIRATLPADTAVPAHVRAMDYAGAETWFDTKPTADNPKSEDGVCRNYTEVFQAIWELLVERQDPQHNQLRNTHLKMPVGDYHIWLSLFTVQPDGTIVGTQLDPTHATAPFAADTIDKNLGRTWKGEHALARAVFGAHNMQLGVSGHTQERLSEDWCLVWMVAHDLATQGRAEDGAKLLLTWLEMLPDVTRQDVQNGFTDDLINGPRRPPKWERPGHAELAAAYKKAIGRDGP